VSDSSFGGTGKPNRRSGGFRLGIAASAQFLVLRQQSRMDSLIVNNILHSMSDCLIVLGKNGEVLFANRAVNEILGFSLDELREKGLGLLFFLKEENYDFNQVFVDAIWKKSLNEYREVDYIRPDGSKRRLAATTSYLKAEDGIDPDFIGFVALFKDITEVFDLRKKEKELLLENQIMARDRLESLRKLAMGVAHEIRNPVVTIGGFAIRIAKNEENPAETRSHAENIVQDAGRLEVIVQEVQDYCDLPPMKRTHGDLSHVVSSAIASLDQRAQRRGIDIVLRTDLPADNIAAIDPDLMEIAVGKLLENSIDFSPDSSRIEVSLDKTDVGTIIEVRDSGTGINEADREFIFDPFFSTRTHGSGMGLAIVEKVVQDHRGRTEVESLPGQGTTMRIILPVSVQ
jgi:PAS domain S-box-containing protein